MVSFSISMKNELHFVTVAETHKASVLRPQSLGFFFKYINLFLHLATSFMP